MAKQFLYACAVLSSLLFVSVSAFDAEAFVSTTRSGAFSFVEAEQPASAKEFVDSQIASLAVPDVPLVIGTVNSFLASHPNAPRQRVVSYYMLHKSDSTAYTATATANSIAMEIPNISQNRRNKWESFEDEL
uniref:uncharacterized protein LOC120346476 n=1 Tax=Styela clava TaxID=7725 RepID=UPI001939A01B|nr:uncharacterized protein LOC120346476 [Styela clava]